MAAFSVELSVLPPSANSIPCIAMAAASGVPHTVVNVHGKTRSPEYMAENPMHCAPQMKTSEGVLWESSAIIRYFAKSTDKGMKYYSNEPWKAAKIDMVMDWCTTKFSKDLPSIGYHIFGFGPYTDEQVKESTDGFGASFAFMESHLLKDSQFRKSPHVSRCRLPGPAPPHPCTLTVAGDACTIADLKVAAYFGFFLSRPDFYATIPAAVTDWLARVEASCPELVEASAGLKGMAQGAAAKA